MPMPMDPKDVYGPQGEYLRLDPFGTAQAKMKPLPPDGKNKAIDLARQMALASALRGK